MERSPTVFRLCLGHDRWRCGQHHPEIPRRVFARRVSVSVSVTEPADPGSDTQTAPAGSTGRASADGSGCLQSRAACDSLTLARHARDSVVVPGRTGCPFSVPPRQRRDRPATAPRPPRDCTAHHPATAQHRSLAPPQPRAGRGRGQHHIAAASSPPSRALLARADSSAPRLSAPHSTATVRPAQHRGRPNVFRGSRGTPAVSAAPSRRLRCVVLPTYSAGSETLERNPGFRSERRIERRSEEDEASRDLGTGREGFEPPTVRLKAGRSP